MKEYTSYDWKKMIRDNRDKLNTEDIIEQIKPYKLNSKMTPTIQMNFQSDVEFARQFWTCSGCADGDLAKEVVGYRDTQQHALICPGYEQFREEKNLNIGPGKIFCSSDKIETRMMSEVM